MCIETVEVNGINGAREAYEISEYLKGVPAIENAECDFIRNTLTIEYDERILTHDQVLDEIEYAGCRPAERKKGLVGWLVGNSPL